MREIELSTFLDAPPDTVIAQVRRPALLEYVTRGVLSFKPIEPPTFPEEWAPGEYLVAMLWKGVVPIGRQIVGIEFPPAEGEKQFVRDNGRGGLVKVWDHLITVEPEGDGARYTDRVRIDAGALTSPVTLFARRFYAHRQKRWRKLVANNFDYDA